MSQRKEIEYEVEHTLTERYQQYYRLAYSYVRNEQDALDIVQESAYKAVKNSGKVKDAEYVSTWIYRIVVNTALDFLRKTRSEVPYEDWDEPVYTPEEEPCDVMELLGHLDKKEQTILILRYFEDRKLEEIADILDENLNTVKAKLYRSLKKLRLGFGEPEGNGGNSYVS